jgi:hypothetical protein
MNKAAVKKKYITNPAIIEELRSLVSRKGILKPEDVVDKARDPLSAMHASFEWDDSRAAELYRIEQARGLLQVTVEVLAGNSDHPSRIFVSLTSDRTEGGYRSMATVLSDGELRARLLNDALEEMQRFEQRYRDLKELAAVFAAVRRVRAKR